jgi:hypothetical protein
VSILRLMARGAGLVLTLGARVASVAATLLVAALYRSYWALVVGLLSGPRRARC